MKASRPTTRFFVGLLIATALFPAAFAQVLSPAKRQSELDTAKKALAPREISSPASDPFHSEAFNELVGLVNKPAVSTSQPESRPAGPRNNRELLQAIANGLKPSGYFVLGGEPTLVFGQKRVKAGGVLTITFEGTEYTLEVTAIDRTNFTLRLNRDEFTRPVK